MIMRGEYAAGTPAPARGIYELRTPFGAPTSLCGAFDIGEPLPNVPQGYFWSMLLCEEHEGEAAQGLPLSAEEAGPDWISYRATPR
jgi:hypothetical protein